MSKRVKRNGSWIEWKTILTQNKKKLLKMEAPHDFTLLGGFCVPVVDELDIEDGRVNGTGDWPTFPENCRELNSKNRQPPLLTALLSAAGGSSV